MKFRVRVSNFTLIVRSKYTTNKKQVETASKELCIPMDNIVIRIMDRVYEFEEARELCIKNGFSDASRLHIHGGDDWIYT